MRDGSPQLSQQPIHPIPGPSLEVRERENLHYISPLHIDHRIRKSAAKVPSG